MKKKYSQYLSGSATPQSAPLPGRDMVKNPAGGYNFKVTPRQRLIRFLTIGSEGASVSLKIVDRLRSFSLTNSGATYYQSEAQLSTENALNVLDLSKLDGLETVQLIVDVSTAKPSRVTKMDPSIFALAVCFAKGNPETKKAALEALPLVCRIPTHLFKFMGACKDLGARLGGRAAKRAINDWYLSKSDGQLAYHLVKYQNREGWRNRDVFRLSHIKPQTEVQHSLIRWSVTGEVPKGTSEAELYLQGANEMLHGGVSKARAVQLIADFGFTHEMVPTNLQREPEIWEALLQRMPMTAMIRNLGRMSNVGILAPLSNAANLVSNKLTQENIVNARIHPMNVLIAHRQYRAGRGLRGKLTWTPNTQILGALDDGFYSAFGGIEPTGKRFMLGLDISSSMGGGTPVMGIPGFSAYEAESALCMIPLRTENRAFATAFTKSLVEVPLSGRESLEEVYEKLKRYAPNMGRTDCAAPMVYAKKHKLEVDVFIIYTDNETWYGQKHPSVALDEYRQATGINAKLIVNSLTATCRTIADPNDRGMLDISGFDSSQPQIVQEFISQ